MCMDLFWRIDFKVQIFIETCHASLDLALTLALGIILFVGPFASILHMHDWEKVD